MHAFQPAGTARHATAFAWNPLSALLAACCCYCTSLGMAVALCFWSRYCRLTRPARARCTFHEIFLFEKGGGVRVSAILHVNEVSMACHGRAVVTVDGTTVPRHPSPANTAPLHRDTATAANNQASASTLSPILRAARKHSAVCCLPHGKGEAKERRPALRPTARQ